MLLISKEMKDLINAFFIQVVCARKLLIANDMWSKTEFETEYGHLLQRLCTAFGNVESITFGIHSKVYIFGTFVIKTNVFGEDREDGQSHWLNWVTQNQSNPLVPVINHFNNDIESDRFIVVMERLAPHSGFFHHSFREDIDQALVRTFKNGLNFGELRLIVQKIKNAILIAIVELQSDVEQMIIDQDQEGLAPLVEAIAEHSCTIEYIDQLEEFDHNLNVKYKDFFAAIVQWFKDILNKGRTIDMHSCNWMLRTNGMPVLLDPIG